MVRACGIYACFALKSSVKYGNVGNLCPWLVTDASFVLRVISRRVATLSTVSNSHVCFVVRLAII